MKTSKLSIVFLLFMSTIIAFSAIYTCTVEASGTINGKINVKSKKYKRNTIVYVEKTDGNFPPPEKHVTMDQIELVFIPHVLPILKGTTVDFLNNDDVAHNVMTPDDVADKMNLGTWAKGEIRSYTFNKLGAAVMLCNVHPEMEAWVVILSTPYFAETDKEGNYTIENVPPGEYTLKVWNKKYKAKGQEIVVKSGETLTVDFKLKR